MVEPRGVQIIDEYSRRSISLDHPRSAIWELLMRGHPEEEAGDMLAHIVELSEKYAASEMQSAIDEWINEGWIESR